jgi:hypothetical protein
MFRTLLITACLAAALAACASAPPGHHTASNAACKTAAGPGAQPQPSSGQCKSFSGEELQRTGEQNAGDALRMVDPEVTIDHH